MRRATAVSQILRAIHDEREQGQPGWSADASVSGGDYRLLVAADRETRERAYGLAHRVYFRRGYAPSDARGLCTSNFDADPETFTLLSEAADGEAAGTASLVFDSPAGLPCDETYRDEMVWLRTRESRLAEVTRLAVDESHANSKHMLMQLFCFVYIYARRVKDCAGLAIEVTPTHARYYTKLLKFEQIGPVRPCPRVNGTYGVLLWLDFDKIEAAVIGTGCTNGRDATGRRIHPYPYSESEERRIARFLAQNHRPMSSEDAHYFGLAATARQSGLLAAAK